MAIRDYDTKNRPTLSESAKDDALIATNFFAWDAARIIRQCRLLLGIILAMLFLYGAASVCTHAFRLAGPALTLTWIDKSAETKGDADKDGKKDDAMKDGPPVDIKKDDPRKDKKEPPPRLPPPDRIAITLVPETTVVGLEILRLLMPDTKKDE